MAFDQATRNRLQRFVSEGRALLTEEFTRQLQNDYGLDPESGAVTPLERMGHLDSARQETARILRVTLAHYQAGSQVSSQAGSQAAKDKDLLERIVREQAFTVLNRLAALRMAEARGFLIESVAVGYRSQGFQLYARLAGSGLGETGDAYRCYLFSLFDEFALDLAVLFDRFSPMGRLFPREATLLALLELMNDEEISPLWAEDETVGWIYQYFNAKEERTQMRKASSAPRNSRELAVRNQFFTPRYVVEFLTDNTLGRTWYEMTQGETGLTESCAYLVRRSTEVFLPDPAQPLTTAPAARWVKAVAEGDFSKLPEDPSIEELSELSLVIDGYEVAGRHGYEDVVAWADGQLEQYRQSGVWALSSLELWLVLFRLQRYWGRRSCELKETFYEEWRSVYRAFREAFATADKPQAEVLKQPVYVAYRALKDPREIRMLDPACGSMHFGLYAFDLYERMYAEAWELEQQGEVLWRRQGLKPLADTYDSKEDLIRDVPRLIIECNIHGVDIDSRAVQIAGLSLWLRAQRSWQGQGLKMRDRPQIQKSHIVCAEPMPGEAHLLAEFVEQHLSASPEQRLIGQLVKRVFEAMKLAGEAGTLLRIDRTIERDIQEAKEQWAKLPKGEQLVLMDLDADQPKQQELALAVAEITDERFWLKAEDEIYAALRRYAEKAERLDTDADERSGRFQRRLFAQDAAKGFAFVDLCRKRYSVTLMNPPFGAGSLQTKAMLAKAYPRTKNDVYAAFVERGLQVLETAGHLGAITSRTGFFLSSFQKWREEILLKESRPTVFADLGAGVLDAAMVETAAYCLVKVI
ncbi:SAM-dependent methyltransferase [Leptolyngbya sp. BC1307]|uniref:Eco57I restriction-modification methylase domain-containing protein n=1 Tax=Leptolyngbya sp. BC1307 TaxID=2029589 RepID=UPI000EFC6530|nr:SAM-dependent methyltransferase [Leptolyngbya sp. BC1307]